MSFLKTLLSAAFMVALLASHSALAQDTTEQKKPKVEFSGFLRLDYWYDSRMNSEVLDGLFIFYPLPQKFDENGVDINANGGLNALALGTRLRTNIAMPNILGAKSSVLVEADFTGLSNNVHMRFRHAFAKLQWNSGTELNLGLTWHPMFVTEVFPHVASLNTGAPFQSFNRSPQLTLKQSITPNLKVILSALTQSDYKNPGPEPENYSTKYLRYSLVPNLHAQLQFIANPITLGVAVDYKNLRPLLSTKSILEPGKFYATNESVNCFSYMAYAKVQQGMLVAKLKGMMGQNLADHLMLGGYAVATLDSLTGRQTYTPLNHAFGQLNITYGKSFMPGIFIAYAKNLGASKAVVNDSQRIYARGGEVDQLYRITPNITYRNSNLTFMAEVEHTIAAIGVIDMTNKAKVKSPNRTANTRILLMVQYDF
jgi:hypothetical protein